MKPTVTSDEVRGTFLEFFLSHAHKRVEGSSLIPQNDPTLLFINSGMAPLKPYFTGQQTPPNPNLCNVQPCLRTRDIDDVGDRHHLTLFEMLGSWSIGHYFKQRAIELAFELLTEGFRFAADRLYATVFAGDEALDLPPDEESASHWESLGIQRSRIVALGARDNFWGPAGDTGPCGPCTEVFYDFGSEYGEAYRPGEVFDTTSRYIEIWNAGVFMQLEKRRDGSFHPLPFFSVDTGAGIERLAMTMNEVPTVYDIDLMRPLVVMAQDLLGQSGDALDHHRLIADHVRAATFILSEGVRPSNEGRGYIPRRLIRKCVAVARQQGAARTFELRELAMSVIDLMSPHYPQLRRRQGDILELLAAEERDFSRAVERGLDQLEGLLASSPDGISGRDAFNLFATYGLPFEITRDLAADRGVTLDEHDFNVHFKLHQSASRGSDKRVTGGLSPTDPLVDLPLPEPRHFVGYETTSSSAEVVAIFRAGDRVDEAVVGETVEVLLDATPFYAEGGGQVGDQGSLRGDDGVRAIVIGTMKHGSGYHVHEVEVVAGSLRAGLTVEAIVDAEKRRKTAANHSATHLLNGALRAVMGQHVRQAGSLVEPERLRFDFTNPGPVPFEHLLEIERIVNEAILSDLKRTTDVLPPDAARQTGAIFLDDEEYGDSIRVVRFGDASIEFCGGTHVDTTAQIGLFRISNEQSVAAGVRRLNAVTRDEALTLTLERDRLLMTAARTLKVNPVSLPDRVQQLASRKAGTGPSASAPSSVDLKVDGSPGIPIAGAVVNAEVDILSVSQQQADVLGAVVALLASAEGKAKVAVAVPKVLIDQVDARAVLQRLLAPIGGRGGGSNGFAQGGGRATAADLARLVNQLPGMVRDEEVGVAP